MITNSVTVFKSGDIGEKLIYQPSPEALTGSIRNLLISVSLPTVLQISAPEKGTLTLAEEWDERYAEFVKAGKHRKLGIYFKHANSASLIRRFGVLLFNKSPAKDIDLLEMLVTRPDKPWFNSGDAIYGKIETGTYGPLEGGDTVSVWVTASEHKLNEAAAQSITALWRRSNDG